MKTLKVSVGFLATLALVLYGVSSACVMDPPNPPPQYWIINHGDPDGDGLNEYWVGIEVDLFNSNGPTTCQCGLGFNTPLPEGGKVKDAKVSIVDRRTHHIIGFVNAFDALTPSEETTKALADRESGLEWTGFAGTIDLSQVPRINPDTQVYKLWFKVLARNLNGLSAGVASGSRFDDPEHPVNFFRPEQPELEPPDPAPVDHLKCYRIKGERLEVPLLLKDQFHEEKVQLLTPELLCNPTVKVHADGETFGIDAGAHQVCYRFEGERSPVEQVEVANQFGHQKLAIDQANLLCLPSTKWHLK